MRISFDIKLAACFVVAACFWSNLSAVALADYEVVQIKTVEWLVDNSDVIAVVIGDSLKEANQVSVVHTLKGHADDLLFPLLDPDPRRFYSWRPQSSSRASVIFVKNRSQQLEHIPIARPTQSTLSDIRSLIYGVSQFGRLILTESELLTMIHRRASSSRPKPLLRKAVGDGDGQVMLASAVSAPANFPLETTNTTYSLIVPFTVEGRDHYIGVLNYGDAAQQVYAIRQLSMFDDPVAQKAISRAITRTSTFPSFKWRRRQLNNSTQADLSSELVTSDGVQRVAKYAIQKQ